jgi:predicted nucleotidyltransferase
MLKEVCGSARRYGVLRTLFESSGREFHLQGIAERAGLDASNVAKLLPRLVAVGLVERIESEPAARYRAHPRNPLLSALVALFTLGSAVVEALHETARELPGDIAIFGSFAKGTSTPDSDIDILIVGPLSQLRAQAAFKSLGRRIERAINVTAISRERLREELLAGSKFWIDVLDGPLVALKGEISRASLD